VEFAFLGPTSAVPSTSKLAKTYFVGFVFLLVGMICFGLSNVAVWMDFIEFSLPVLEIFLHQPEMDIANIFRTTYV